jgi:DNA processing protein
MAVPGSPMDGRAGGCNVLIREGATLVRSADDILEALGETAGPPAASMPAPAPEPAPAAVAAVVQTAGGDAEGRILSLLGPTPVAEDILIRETGQPAPAVAAMLLDLELAGRICRHPGGLISRTGA